MDILIIQRPRGNNKGGTFTDKSPTLSAHAWEQNHLLVTREIRQLNPSTESGHKQPYQQNRIYDADGIMPALSSAHAGHSPLVVYDEIVRRLTPTEAARLQTIPTGINGMLRHTAIHHARQRMDGRYNKHIFSFL